MSGEALLALAAENAAMKRDITHLLHAIDRGYFIDKLLPNSAFVECLRPYAAPGFKPVNRIAAEQVPS